LKNIKISFIGILLLLLPVIFSVTGCGDTQLNSKWRTQNLIIDGKDIDWGNTLNYIDDLKALVGVENDNKFLYLCLVTNDQELEVKVLSMGLTIWFDRTANDDKDFGIKFPIGRGGINKTAMRKMIDNPVGERPNLEKMREMVVKNENEVEIMGKNNDISRVPITELKGVKVKLGLKGGRLVYEMKIPLSHKGVFNYALNADTGSTISVGLETGRFQGKSNGEKVFKRPERGEGGFGPSAGGDGDNYGGEGMGRGEGGRERGSYGGRRGDFNRSSLEPVSFWAKVKLAGGIK
jgi:hypothetical protein